MHLNTKYRNPAVWNAIAVGLVVLLGCGSVEDDYGVTGNVTLDGSPLADATISFVSDDTSLTGASARTNASGMYTAEISADRNGLTVGKYQVRISTYEEGNDQVEPPMLGLEERVPTKYNSATELEVEVKPEINIFDFNLDSDGEIEQ